MSCRAWTTFRAVRIAVFVFATLLSIACTVIFAVLLLCEWNLYDAAQHTIVIISLTINGICSILLYLMIVVRFRLWLDAARVAFILLFDIGSTIAFALFGPSMPCNNLGSEASCRKVVSAVINLGWAQTGLLLLYAFYLAAMSYVPLPPPRSNPEAVLVDSKRPLSPIPSQNSRTHLRKQGEKRQSRSSVHSHGTFIQPHISNSSPYGSPKSSVRSISVSSRQKYGVYRPVTPVSFHSSASSSYSSTRGHDDGPASPYPLTPAPIRAPILQNLPNSFADFEPVYRQPLPHSDLSSIHSEHSGRPYTPVTPHPAMTLPSGFNGSQGIPPPPYLDRVWWVDHRGVVNPSTPRSPMSSGQLTVPPTPSSLRPHVQSSLPPRELTASPGMQSVRSLSVSLHDMPGRIAVLSPAMSTRSVGLPATPRMMILPPPPIASVESGMRRYQSVPAGLNRMAQAQAPIGV